MTIRLSVEHGAFEEQIDNIEESSDYAALVASVERTYEELGAVVMEGVSTQGEAPRTELFIRPESTYPNYPA